MVTLSEWDELPDVEAQTQLDNPIKVRWRGKDRQRVRRSLVAALESGWMERGVAAPVMRRQKTQIVIKTEEELEAFRDVLRSKAKHRVRKRIDDEIESQLADITTDDNTGTTSNHSQNAVVSYDPPLQDHPCYVDTEVDFEVGDVVKLLSYSGMRTLYDDDRCAVGQERYNPNGTSAYHVVRDIDGYRVKVAWADRDDPKHVKWIPRDRIVGTSVHQKALFEYRDVKRRRYRKRVEQRKQTDMDVLMDEVVKPHARQKCSEVWPGGTVDVDEICWFWNPQLTNAAGMAYYGNAVPQSMASGRLAIGLAPDYFYQKGIDHLLEIVRHELVHCWQYMHPDSNGGGHGPKFKQWIDDMDTHRHCKRWSKETPASKMVRSDD